MPTVLGLVLWACWVLAGSILGLVSMMVLRRRWRQRYFDQLDRWRVQLPMVLPRWVVERRVPRAWVTDPIRRTLLVEAVASRIDFEGQKCRRRGACPLVPTGMGIRCREPGETCNVPSLFRGLAQEWGLVDQLTAVVKRRYGLGRAEAVISLGQMRHPGSIPVLADLLTDSSADVRLAAVRALGLLGTPEAGQPLLQLLQRARIRVSLPSLQRALMHCCKTQPQMLGSHLSLLKGRRQALLTRVLAEIATAEALPVLELLTASAQAQTRADTARALGRIRTAEALALLARLAHDPVWFVRVRTMRALGQTRGWKAVELLLEGLEDDRPEVAQGAAESLARQSLPLDQLLQKARERLTLVGWSQLVGELGREGHIWMLAEHLASPVERVQQFGQQWLRAVIEGGAHKTVLDVLTHPDSAVADAMAEFLGRWGQSSWLAELESMAAKTAVDSPLLHRLSRVRAQICERARTLGS
ncbi:MAG: HEAT repeat domain-containing protein [Terriglobia bacterium]